ncbi:hypothetical protein ACMXYV_05120 [Neptuniibacter sp. SY11_33]|uniref:hypothetical protein n=1 Tax=Neptuniibacter sp. SY11_33 TaxID=3398215 RepID=UPI0039F4EB45
MEWILALIAAVIVGLYFNKLRKTKRELKSKADKRYRAVSIESGLYPCAAVDQLDDRRFFPDKAPMIPLPGCSASKNCECRYRHHDDRRDPENERRIDNIITAQKIGEQLGGKFSGRERRIFHKGRRWQERQATQI